MNIQEIMTPRVATVRSSDLLSTAAQLMLWAAGRHLVVVDNGRVVGVLSSGDLFRARATDPSDPLMTVRQAMTSPVHTAKANDKADIVAGRMARERIGCLPVLDGDQLVGIVTTTDALAAFERQTAPARPESHLGTEIDEFRAIRDRMRLQAHLGRMELRDSWHTFQDDVAHAERIIANAGDSAMGFIKKARASAEQAYAALLREAQRELTAANRRARQHRLKTQARTRAVDAPK